MAKMKLLLALVILLPLISGANRAGPAARQAGCRQDSLVPWNCAGLFSGSFGWKSVLTGGPPDAQVNITEDVTVAIKAGVATCVGARKGHTRTKTDDTELALTINGPGLVAVEYGTNTEDDPKGPYYRITVACPDPAGEEITTHLANGQKNVEKQAGAPPKGFNGSQMSSDKQPGTQKDITLQGSTVNENPDADVANLLTGTLTVTWKLVKK